MADDDDHYLRTLGSVVDAAGMLEQTMAAQLAAIVARGDARIGLLVIGGQSAEWMSSRFERIGRRYPKQVPGLADWARLCSGVLERRNRAIHDWHGRNADGTRTSMRFTSKDTRAVPSGFATRPNTVPELEQLATDLADAQNGFSALCVGLGARMWTLDPDAG
jgi:hypothetical protein